MNARFGPRTLVLLFYIGISLAAIAGTILATIVAGRNPDPASAWLLKCVTILFLVVGLTWACMKRSGITWKRYGVSADGAFELLRHWSQDSNTKLNHLAVVLTTGPKDGPAGVCPEPRPS